MARKVSTPTGDTVRTDDVGGGLLATRHLLDLGHRDIAHVDAGRASGSRERRLGYRRAMQAADPALEPRVVSGGLTEDEGARAAEAMLDEPAAGCGRCPPGSSPSTTAAPWGW